MRFALSTLLALLLLVGCAGAPVLPPGLTPAGATGGSTRQSTSVGLSRDNYRVVRTAVTGESRGFVLLLFLNVIPTSPIQAWDRLYQAAGLEPGGTWALANVVEERQTRSFLLFGLPRIRVRADVVEFVPQAGGAQP